MRRKDREMSREFALEVVDRATFGTIALWDEEKEESYSLPLSLVRVGETLYFHSAKTGRKTELLKEGQRLSASFVAWNEVPDTFSVEAVREMVADPKTLPRLLSRVFTTQFASAVVTGTLRMVSGEKEVEEAMEAICLKYTPDKMEFFLPALKAGAPRMQVYALDILEIHGKRKKLDKFGEEMKWGRME